MTEYTRKESLAINAAFSALAYIAECSSWGDPPRLREALRYETRQRGSSLVAKALIVREALGGVMVSRGVGVQCSAAELWSRCSPGILSGYLFGGWCGIQQGRLCKLTDEFVTKAEASNEAHGNAIDRGYAAVRAAS
jgi:hypothetical protein